MNEKQLAAQVVNEVKKAVVGKDEVIGKALLVILARGHLLLEDIPGVGKTTMALAFSKALGLSYRRVQFTPDVMPSDLTGFTLYQKDTGRMEYQPGALLCNLFLADELNRATSRTQSALLEAMEEGQVTVDGVSHPIPEPCVVIATQHPVGAAGTPRRPDAHRARFAQRGALGEPEQNAELELLRRKQRGDPLEGVNEVVTHQELARLRATADAVYVDDDLLAYVIRLVRATRGHPQLLQGASPRASIAVTALARAVALLQGRDYVIPEDVAYVWVDAVSHRLLLPAGQAGETPRVRRLAAEVLQSVRPPRIR